ncbi:MAG: Uma2 family endonuclease [Chloroflexota bacterium]
MTEATLHRPLLTLDELMTADYERMEIINGEIVPMSAASGRHHIVAGNIYRILEAYASLKGTGAVFFDGLHYLMFSSEAGLTDSFIPDTSLVLKRNIPAGWNIDKPHPGVPDLAVEVISPGDQADMVIQKARTYLRKGTKQVWLVYPKTKELHKYVSDDPATVTVFAESQKIDAAPLLPDLNITTDQVFAMPDWVDEG